MKISTDNFWPTPQQELLLKAALLPNQKAIDAWEKWASQVDIEDLDTGSYRLLPLVYRNLESQDAPIEHPAWPRLKGYYRKTWVENQLLFYRMTKLVRQFQDAGIETLVLKGVPLVLLYYKDYGARPMGDFDLLVQAEQAPLALDLLLESGWESVIGLPKSFDEAFMANCHAHMFRKEGDGDFDLHWHVLADSRHLNANDDFWEGAEPTKLHDVSILALNPTDQLLHVCMVLNGVQCLLFDGSQMRPPFSKHQSRILSGIDWFSRLKNIG